MNVAFIIYDEILKDCNPTRDEDTSEIFIFIPPFKDNPIREITEEVVKQVSWLKSFYGAILIKKKPQMQYLEEEGHACEKEEMTEMEYKQEKNLCEEETKNQQDDEYLDAPQPHVIPMSTSHVVSHEVEVKTLDYPSLFFLMKMLIVFKRRMMPLFSLFL